VWTDGLPTDVPPCPTATQVLYVCAGVVALSAPGVAAGRREVAALLALPEPLGGDAELASYFRDPAGAPGFHGTKVRDAGLSGYRNREVFGIPGRVEVEARLAGVPCRNAGVFGGGADREAPPEARGGDARGRAETRPAEVSYGLCAIIVAAGTRAQRRETLSPPGSCDPRPLYSPPRGLRSSLLFAAA
jgi:hypothetical protein